MHNYVITIRADDTFLQMALLVDSFPPIGSMDTLGENEGKLLRFETSFMKIIEHQTIAGVPQLLM